MSVNSSVECVQHDFSVGKQKFSAYETSGAGSPQMMARSLERAVTTTTTKLGLSVNGNVGGQTEGRGPGDLSGFTNKKNDLGEQEEEMGGTSAASVCGFASCRRTFTRQPLNW